MEYKGFTYTPAQKTAWDNLPMLEKSEMIKMAVKNGIYDLQTIRQKYNEFAEGGSKEEEEEVNTIVPFTQRREVIITPDSKYNQYLNTLPDNQRFTPNDKYDSYFYWKLNGRPKNFDEAYSKGMFHYDNSDKSYHANSIAFGKDDIGYFMKPKTHDTVGYELDWFNKGLVTEEGGKQRPVTPEEAIELEEFRRNYFLTDDPDRPNYYRYQPKKKAEGGSIHIASSKRGTFTAAATKHGMGVQEFASKVLANKDNYSPAMVKKANFARNARKFKHALGGSLVENAFCPEDKNLYGFGDWLKGAYNKAKSVVNKGREIVRDLGLDKSPAQHVTEKISAIDEKTKNTRYGNNNLGFLERNGLAAAKAIGLDKRYKDAAFDSHYRQNLFNMVDPTSAVPSTVEEAVAILIAAEAAKSNRDYKYRRKYQEPTADAAWAKRLGLPYDSTLLIANPDGSVHLSEQLEKEIPTDTVFLKNRIADNEKLLDKNYGAKRQAINLALRFDKEALDALRHTYKTGEPVTMHEASHMSRSWIKNGEVDYGITPLSALHRYTLQYNKDNNTMPYFDTYNFDEFEDFVPGKPFQIKGVIDLNKKK